MSSVRIRRFSARYRLPVGRLDERTRLDRVLEIAFHEMLELALERAGISAQEQVCIRSLYVPVRLRMSLADSALAATWALSLAEAVARARQGNNVPGVVVYHSRRQALVDVVIGVASGQLDRIWAWRLAGVWTDRDTASPAAAFAGLTSALLAEPEAIAAIMAALASARPELFAVLLKRVTPAHWVKLAEAALAAANAEPALASETITPGISESLSVSRRIGRWPVFAAVARTLPVLLLEQAEFRRALAALIALDGDPGTLRERSRARELLSSIADALYPVSIAARMDSPISKAEQPANAVSSDPAPPLRAPARAVTRFGGLLFLLRIIEALGIVDEIQSRTDRRPFRWLLHQLGLALVPAAAIDPAVVAFAGLPPDCQPPGLNEDSATDDELQWLSMAAHRIQQHLTLLIGEPEGGRHALDFVCLRTAEIVADPGWIEIRLSLSEVSTSIRRAGIDIDPGWLPWLGTVIRFVYD